VNKRKERWEKGNQKVLTFDYIEEISSGVLLYCRVAIGNNILPFI
jgi:hypothetical protein